MILKPPDSFFRFHSSLAVSNWNTDTNTPIIVGTVIIVAIFSSGTLDLKVFNGTWLNYTLMNVKKKTVSDFVCHLEFRHVKILIIK